MQRRSTSSRATRAVAGSGAIAGAGTVNSLLGVSAKTVSSAKPIVPTATVSVEY